ncbi:PIG-L family deacetylase [Saccharomonospora xinjiangensis]|uniref:GlcNAc-PI de-N-acetylase n=1 Tax=Saccharomonospora xinjiangensis XJ-54 TaxID=882086 RepID=I0V6J2_9PSEU|nr:PIG-L family deacetylase [Saccharomonospora xinjiangensis]EID55745.1 GlcNAc-PI de-N-acetylase [Saccharomonospora xinjiangensis XJ-54]
MHVVFHIGGHPDDALLFKGEMLYNDLHWPDVKVVSIVTTAGDAGRIDDWWWTREHGLVESLRAAKPEDFTPAVVTINGRRLRCYRAGSWRCYFLRLPDGNIDGTGFSSTGFQSLPKLRDGVISGLDSLGTPEIPAQHCSSWADVVQTLRAVVSAEGQGATNPNPWVHASDHDRSRNPGDHPDHYATGDALRSFLAQDGCNRAWWVSYDTANRPANLSGTALANKRALYYNGYVQLVTRIMGRKPAECDAEWARWGARDYWREETV